MELLQCTMANTFHTLRLQNKKIETSDTVSFYLEIPEGLSETFNFTAGQYITVEVDYKGETLRRSYSLSTSPYENEMAFTVKRVQDGRVSNYLIDQIQVGDDMTIGAPEGKFVAKANPALKRDHYFIAAGSGITPVMSMIKTLLEEEPKSSLYLFYGNRTEDSIIFKATLDQLSKTYEGQLHLSYCLSGVKPKGKLKGLFSKKTNDWEGKYGRINANLLAEFMEDFPPRNSEQIYYLCGPGGLIESTEDFLSTKGIAKSAILKEYFSSPDETKEASSSGAGGAGNVLVKLDGDEFEISIPADKSILDVLIDEGKNPPYSCTSGACSSCVAKVLEGEVSMDSCFALDDDEVKDGYILTCQAHPVSEKVTIEYE